MIKNKLSVILVDDEKIIREGMKKLFAWEENGYFISGESANGRDALPLIISKKPDVVITDLKMPFMDGIALADAIAERCPITEVVVITGFDEFTYAQNAVRAGVFEFLLKPVSPDELKDTMQRLKDKITHRKVGYPFAQEAAIINAIHSGNPELAFKALEIVFEYFSENRVSQDIIFKITNKILTEIESTYINIMGSHAIIPKPELTTDIPIEKIKTQFEKYLIEIFYTDILDSTDLLVKKIKRYLEKHYQENITLKMLEDLFFYNSSYISRVFKCKTGENYNEFLTKIRIQQAKELLANTSHSIQQISEMVGFTNPKYFSRMFRDYTQLRPIAYRNTNIIRGDEKHV